jgi:hypothetical protein
VTVLHTLSLLAGDPIGARGAVDAEGRRGQVVYRRYDGHYGLITPA